MDIGIGTSEQVSNLMVAAAFVAILAVNMLMLALRWPQLMSALAGPQFDQSGMTAVMPEAPRPVPVRPVSRTAKDARRHILNPATLPALAA